MTNDWPARVVRRRDDGHVAELMCGVRHPVTGRYLCQGNIGMLQRVPGMPTQASPGVGMTEDPPGSHHWRPTARRRRREANPRATGDRFDAPLVRHFQARHVTSNPSEATIALLFPPLPWTRPCPSCGRLARVDSDVVESLPDA